MSHASLRDQLRAVASQLSDTFKETPVKEESKKQKSHGSKKPIKRPQSSNKSFKKESDKPKWLQYAHQGVALLQQHFPKCFKSKQQIQPLKVGIKVDLIKRLKDLEIPSEDKACMVKSLSYYVNLIGYHKQVKVGAERIDLDGVVVSTVTEKEANYSATKIETRLAAKQQAKDPKETPSST